MPKKVCLGCNRLFEGPGSRHKQCDPRRAFNTSTERNRRRETIQMWVARHGYVCPGFHTDPHAAHPQDNPLQADHLVAIADGGAESGALGVLCRRCNLNKRHGKHPNLGRYDHPG